MAFAEAASNFSSADGGSDILSPSKVLVAGEINAVNCADHCSGGLASASMTFDAVKDNGEVSPSQGKWI